MNRERLSTVCVILGLMGTIGLVTSGVLLHYGILPLQGGIALPLIAVSGVLGIAGMALSVGLAMGLSRATWLYIVLIVIYGISLLGTIMSFITIQDGNDSWWRAVIFSVLLVGTSLLLPLVRRRRKAGKQ